MRLDHIIAEVADIERAAQDWSRAGFAEAWPIGRFWPWGLTCGIRLPGYNLELLQPLDRLPVEPAVTTLVFAPESVEVALDSLRKVGLQATVFEKVEPDPALLRLRGFSEEDARSPQPICTNINPVDPPFPFFCCVYAPFLRERLDPMPGGTPPSFGFGKDARAGEIAKALGLDRFVRFFPSEHPGGPMPEPANVR